MESLVQSFLNSSEDEAAASLLRGRSWFQWGGTISAVVLLFLNSVRRSSRTQTSLLVAYLISSLPTVFFNIFRGSFGHWVAFLAAAGHLFCPREIPVSRFVLFVITPSRVAHEMHDTILGGILCLIIGILLLIEEIRGISRSVNDRENQFFVLYCLGMLSLFYSTISYLLKNHNYYGNSGAVGLFGSYTPNLWSP